MSDKQLHTFKGMEYTRAEYVEAKKSDKAFAAQASEALGEEYTFAQIREYRRTFGFAHGAQSRTPSALVQELAKAKELLQEALIVPNVLSEDLATRITEFLK